MTMITMVIFTFGVLTFNPCLPSQIHMSEGLEENNPLNECLPAFHPLSAFLRSFLIFPHHSAVSSPRRLAFSRPGASPKNKLLRKAGSCS